MGGRGLLFVVPPRVYHHGTVADGLTPVAPGLPALPDVKDGILGFGIVVVLDTVKEK